MNEIPSFFSHKAIFYGFRQPGLYSISHMKQVYDTFMLLFLLFLWCLILISFIIWKILFLLPEFHRRN